MTHIAYRLSRNGGNTWTEATTLDWPNEGADPYLAFSPSGRMMLVWLDLGSDATIKAATLEPGDSERYSDGVTTMAELGLDPVGCVAQGQEVWTLYGVTDEPRVTEDPRRHGALNGIRVAYSRDGGATFNRRLEVLRSGGLARVPQIALGRDGTVHVVYYFGSWENDARGSLRWRWLVPNADTFGDPVVIAEPLHFNLEWGSAKWFGDYFGVGISGDCLLVSYADNGESSTRVMFERADANLGWERGSPFFGQLAI